MQHAKTLKASPGLRTVGENPENSESYKDESVMLFPA